MTPLIVGALTTVLSRTTATCFLFVPLPYASRVRFVHASWPLLLKRRTTSDAPVVGSVPAVALDTSVPRTLATSSSYLVCVPSHATACCFGSTTDAAGRLLSFSQVTYGMLYCIATGSTEISSGERF